MQLVHTEEVTGSIPVSPTRSEAMWISIKLTTGAIPASKWSASPVRCQAMVGRRGWGEDSVYLDHSGEVLLAGHRRRAARPLRLVRVRCLESPGRRPDRGGTCAAVGSCRPGGRPP